MPSDHATGYRELLHAVLFGDLDDVQRAEHVRQIIPEDTIYCGFSSFFYFLPQYIEQTGFINIKKLYPRSLTQLGYHPLWDTFQALFMNRGTVLYACVHSYWLRIVDHITKLDRTVGQYASLKAVLIECTL